MLQVDLLTFLGLVAVAEVGHGGRQDVSDPATDSTSTMNELRRELGVCMGSPTNNSIKCRRVVKCLRRRGSRVQTKLYTLQADSKFETGSSTDSLRTTQETESLNYMTAAWVYLSVFNFT